MIHRAKRYEPYQNCNLQLENSYFYHKFSIKQEMIFLGCFLGRSTKNVRRNAITTANSLKKNSHFQLKTL